MGIRLDSSELSALHGLAKFRGDETLFDIVNATNEKNSFVMMWLRRHLNVKKEEQK